MPTSPQLTAPSNFSIAENPYDLTVAAGCIAPATSLALLIDTTNMDPATNETTMAYPCFDHRTLTDLLDQNKTGILFERTAAKLTFVENKLFIGFVFIDWI